jgi:predicted nucleotidyltransferase
MSIGVQTKAVMYVVLRSQQFFYIAIMQNQHLIDEMTERLKELKPYKVILFGSYAKGNPTEDSDLDVLVVLDSDEVAKSFKEQNARYLLASNAVREVNYKIPMDILVYSKAEYDYLNKQNTYLFREIKNTGRILYEK